MLVDEPQHMHMCEWGLPVIVTELCNIEKLLAGLCGC